MSAAKLSSARIYPGVSIGDLDVGDLTKEEAAQLLESHYAVEDGDELTLTCEGESRTVSLSTLAPTLNVDGMIADAYELGRSGSFFSRLREIHSMKKNPVSVPVDLTLDEDALYSAVRSLAEVVDQPEEEHTFTIENDTLVITRGHSGKRILPEHAKELVSACLTEPDGSSSRTLELPLETVEPEEITVDYLMSKVCGDPVDASYHVENYKLVFEEAKPGVSMDASEAEKILKNADSDTIRIPVVVTPAKITAQQLRSGMFSDLLGTYSTTYNTGDANRSHNISLACQSINEAVLAPGDVFSYNGAVGPRTAARGYREAHVYVGNQVEDGLGGGICQVSSTLYNAVVLSDLKIVSRTNHSLPVSYVPMGRDATVSYGSVDFKFENNTGAPLKIVSSAGGGQTTVSIYGKNAHPGRSVSIESVCTATRAPSTEQKKDPELPEGTVRVEQYGSNGYDYQSYKIVTENGTQVSREPLAKSTYVPVNRIELIGTKPPEPLPAVEDPQPEEAPPESPSVPDQGADASSPAEPTENANIAPLNPAA